MGDLSELRQAQEKLRAEADRHKNQRAYRDHLIREAIRDGHTWAEVQRAAGLTPRAVQLALKRPE